MSLCVYASMRLCVYASTTNVTTCYVLHTPTAYGPTTPSEVVKHKETPRPLSPNALLPCPAVCPAVCLDACIAARFASLFSLALKRSAIFGNAVHQARGIMLWIKTPSPQKPTASTKDIQRTSQGVPTMQWKRRPRSASIVFSSPPFSNHNMAFLYHLSGTRA